MFIKCLKKIKITKSQKVQSTKNEFSVSEKKDIEVFKVDDGGVYGH